MLEQGIDIQQTQTSVVILPKVCEMSFPFDLFDIRRLFCSIALNSSNSWIISFFSSVVRALYSSTSFVTNVKVSFPCVAVTAMRKETKQGVSLTEPFLVPFLHFLPAEGIPSAGFFPMCICYWIVAHF